MPAFLFLRPLALAALSLLPMDLAAETAQAQDRAIILTVSGLPGAPQTFDRAALQELGPVTFTTTSIWTEGPHSFTGIPLARLAQALQIAPSARVLLRALNDYAVEMPLSEAGPQAPILAYEMDGKPMSVRDKGPIWVVYPYDADPAAFQSVTTYARSVWQLDRIEILP